MKFAPLFMLFFGYWCFSNKQIFSNEVYPIHFTTEAVQTGHKVWSMNVNPGLPLLLVGLAIAGMMLFSEFTLRLLRKYGVLAEDEEDEVDEGLGSYWECINDHDRREWMLDELHMQKNLGI